MRPRIKRLTVQEVIQQLDYQWQMVQDGILEIQKNSNVTYKVAKTIYKVNNPEIDYVALGYSAIKRQ